MKAARYSWIALFAALTATAARAGDTPPTQADPQPPKEDGGPKGPGPRGDGQGRGEGMRRGMERAAEAWKKADTDGDGFLSPAEFAATERVAQLTPEKRDELFKRFDKDGDGKLSHEEMSFRQPGPIPDGIDLKKLDSNGDGKIDFDEFKAAEWVKRLPEERQQNIFKRFDTDGDGKLSQEELKPRPRPDGGGGGDGPRGPRLQELDRNQDGKIDFEEFKTDEFIKRLPEERQQNMFKRFDTDGDGFLTPKDHPQRDGRGGGRGRGGLLDLIKDNDKDGNGSLSFEEFRQIPWIKNAGEDDQEQRFNDFDRNKDQKLDAADVPPPGEKPERPDKPDRPDRPDKPKDTKKPGEGI